MLTILTRCPIALAGRLVLNFARTDPVAPWGRVTLPQIARTLDFFFGRPGTDTNRLAYKHKSNHNLIVIL